MHSAAAMPFDPEPVSEAAAVVVAVGVVAAVVVVDVAAEDGGASIAAASNSAGPAELNFLDLPAVRRWRILLGQVLSY